MTIVKSMYEFLVVSGGYSRNLGRKCFIDRHLGLAYSGLGPCCVPGVVEVRGGTMNLKSLLLCSDEKIVRVLRRTLGELDISVEACATAEIALRHLTRGRYEAIIVDCAGPGAGDVLGVVRTSPGNLRAVAVAILDPDTGLRSAFELGANFILYKPVTAERAKSSFRAARALMKKERRRNTRVPIRFPVEMSSRESGVRLKVNTTDLGEGGLAVSLPGAASRRGGGS